MKQKIKQISIIHREPHPLGQFKKKKNKKLMNMAFTHLKCLFNENEPCDALRDDYLKIAQFYDAEKKKAES